MTMSAPAAVGIFAHVDAGKTTLSEQLLYLAGVIRSAGRVDHGDTVLDTDEIERLRGITVFSAQAEFLWKGRRLILMDTPGHVDFSAEAERAFPALDMAVLVLDGAAGVDPHTVSLLLMAREYRVPAVLFMNKTDLPGFDRSSLLKQAESRLGLPLIPVEDGEPDGEALSLLNDDFCEKYLSGEASAAEALSLLTELFEKRRALPVIFGAALKGEGVAALADLLSDLAPAVTARYRDASAPAEALVYRVRREGGERVTWLRLRQGTLRARAEFRFGEVTEKIHQLRVYTGGEFRQVTEALPGDAVAVTGLTVPKCGGILREDGCEAPAPMLSVPVLGVRVCPPEGTAPQTLMEKLRLLEDEDPLLSAAWSDDKAVPMVRVMGAVQVEVLAQLLENRFGLKCAFLPPQVLYAETLAAPSVGCGHYEPLKHYAEAHLLLSPAPRGNGIRFESRCHVDDLPVSYQSLIRTHVLEKEHRGVLTGAPVTDLTVTLLSGKMHLKHTEGGDFREAVYRAVRQGLMKGKSLLLEPWYRFTLLLPPDCRGRAMNDIIAMSGSFDTPEEENGLVTIRGRAPVSAMMDYPLKVRSYSHGAGSILLEPDGMDLCHNPDEVTAAAAYRPEGDTENSPGSVFCSHGAGFFVPWQEADAMMHLPVETAE